jgi:hypothetical protein
MKQTFAIVPAPGAAGVTFFAITGFLVLMLALFGWFAWSSRRTTFEISREGLALRGGLYGRFIPAQDLLADQARAIDLTTERDLQFSMRTNGIGMPGYLSGWFRMRNGGKALAFITDRRHVAYVPTRQGYSVFVSVSSPDEFVQALQHYR